MKSHVVVFLVDLGVNEFQSIAHESVQFSYSSHETPWDSAPDASHQLLSKASEDKPACALGLTPCLLLLSPTPPYLSAEALIGQLCHVACGYLSNIWIYKSQYLFSVLQSSNPGISITKTDYQPSSFPQVRRAPAGR